MKILLLAPHPFFQHRGTPIAVKALLEVLSAEGHRIDVITYHEGETVEIPSVTVHRIAALPGVRGIRPGFSLKKLLCDGLMFVKCLRFARRGNYDLIHAVEESAFMALLAKLLFRVPYVYDMDSSLAQQMIEKYAGLRHVRRFLEAFEGKAVRGSLGVIAVCKALEETAHRYDPEKRVLRLEDPSLLDMSPGGEADSLREMLGLRGPMAMYVGNLEHYQGVDLLVESMPEVVRCVPDASLVIIGGAEEHIREYREKARALGVEGSVHLVGPRPVTQLGLYLTQADVLVSPRSHGYNTPMKIYSYLDSGRPTVATRLPTHTQVLDDEIACLVEADAASMAAGLVRLLRDPDLREATARRARERVEQEFSPEAFRRKLTAFYRSLVLEVEAAG